MTTSLRQVLVLLACTGGLACLLGQVNHALSPLAVTLAAPGLLVAFVALRLPLAAGLAVALLTGLWIDATAPVAFGRQAALLGLAVCLVHRVRGRLPREETLVGVVVALFVNLAFFVVFAFLSLGELPDPGAGALRLLADLLVSQLATALIGPWFLALQRQALIHARAMPEVVARRFA